ncbi:hypothetical protein [Gandjariella thermophila]|uniref:Uncharacterized protein n=1 Tax=Gandjariella thermophila TaxID=1931992 RepID=A0A4D4JAM3_9PSEU|nr:hypothetical protein [Gandjariella thermophila]GDY30873.1 hypothetical protein GTS_25060 [Gandjariella thermophila]
MTGPTLGLPNIPTSDPSRALATAFSWPTWSTDDDTLRVEPLAGLEWSHAVELPHVDAATTPAGIRQAWIHRAPEARVLALYRAVLATEPDAPAPWWLRALHDGLLASREAGFEVEDDVATLLANRPGWVYVPWTGAGEDGYWEFVPSETTAHGVGVPTTVVLTHRHPGWIDVLPAHREGAVQAVVPMDGVPDLAAQLDELEAIALP